MPYRKRIFTYPGGRVEEKYFTCRLGGKKTRIKNFNKTPEAVAKVNARRATSHESLAVLIPIALLKPAI